MIRPHVEFCDFKLIEKRSRSNPTSIIIVVETKSDEIQLSPSVRIDISRLPSFSSHGPIRRLIADQLINRHWLAPNISRASKKLGFGRSELLRDSFVSHRWLADYLASEFSWAGVDEFLDFGLNGSILSFTAKITPSPSKEEVLTRMVQLGMMSKEDLKSSKMETEPCSICLDNLGVSRGSNSKRGVPTRMTCSHVFHDGCLLVWLQRRNTCPLCRTVLYDRSMIGKERG